MQLMPGTQAHLGVTDPFDPRANVEAGSLYLRRQLDAFGTLELALAAYNAGPGNRAAPRRHSPFSRNAGFRAQGPGALYPLSIRAKKYARVKDTVFGNA